METSTVRTCTCGSQEFHYRKIPGQDAYRLHCKRCGRPVKEKEGS